MCPQTIAVSLSRPSCHSTGRSSPNSRCARVSALRKKQKKQNHPCRKSPKSAEGFTRGQFSDSRPGPCLSSSSACHSQIQSVETKLGELRAGLIPSACPRDMSRRTVSVPAVCSVCSRTAVLRSGGSRPAHGERDAAEVRSNTQPNLQQIHTQSARARAHAPRCCGELSEWTFVHGSREEPQQQQTTRSLKFLGGTVRANDRKKYFSSASCDFIHLSVG